MPEQFDDFGEIIREDISRLDQYKLTRKRYIIVRKYLIDKVNDLTISINRLTHEIEKLEGARNKHATK